MTSGRSPTAAPAVGLPRTSRGDVLGLLAAALALAQGACHMSNADPTRGLDPAVRAVSEAYTAARERPDDRAALQAAAARLDELSQAAGPGIAPALRYHHARLAALAGERDRALRELDELSRAEWPLPETLWLKIQLTHVEGDPRGNRLRWELEARLGEALPISAWGRLRDARLEAAEAEKRRLPQKDNPDWPTIPIVDRDKLLRIAALFDDMKLYAEAAEAYREAVYGGMLPPGFPSPGSETWISEQAAEVWLSVARCAIRGDRPAWAGHALLMAVAPSAGRLARVRSYAEELSTPARLRLPPPEPTRAKLLEIAQLYCDCHLHPRALAALDRAAQLPGDDLSCMRRDTEQSWVELLEEYCTDRPSIAHLFGQRIEVAPDKLRLAPRRLP
jgi:hypothetical protein